MRDWVEVGVRHGRVEDVLGDEHDIPHNLRVAETVQEVRAHLSLETAPGDDVREGGHVGELNRGGVHTENRE